MPAPAGIDSPRWCHAARVATRPRGVRARRPDAHQEGLRDLLDGLALLPHRDGQGGDAHRPAAEAAAQHVEHRPVEPVEAGLVDLVELEGRARHRQGHHTVGAHLGVVADPAQQPVGDARRAPRAGGDLGGALGGQLDPEQAGGAVHDEVELVRLVELEVGGEAEAVAQRAGQQAGAGGGADQGERRDLQRDRGRPRSLADDDVDPEVLHRHVEHLLGRARHPVDLVDEEDVALVEARTGSRPGRRRG